jgi:hypothetical protein
VSNETFLDISATFTKSTGDVVDNALALGVVEDSSEEVASLFVVIVGMVVCVTSDLTVVVSSVPGGGGVFNGTVSGVRLVVDFTSLVAVNAHGTVTDHVSSTSAVGAVDRDLLVVGTKSVSVGVGVGEKTSLKHLVKRSLNSGNQVRGRESRLLSLSVEVLGVTVEDHSSNINERVVFLRPDFSNVIDIKSVFGSISDGHHLHFHGPAREVFVFDVVVKVIGSKVLISSHLSGTSLGSEVLDSLIGLEVVFNQELFVLGIDPLEGVGRVSVHVSESIRSSTVGHQNSHLVEGFGRVRPEIKLHVRIVGSLDGARLLRVDEVGELDGVLNEENRGVVSDHVVVAFFSVEFDGETTGISQGIRCTSLSSDGRETGEARSSLGLFVEEVSLGVPSHKK